MQGIEGKIGILNSKDFIANKGNKYMWHFWGKKDEITASKTLKVVAIELKTNKEFPALIEGAGTENKKHVWEYKGIGGPVNGAIAHVPSIMELSTKGLWQLNAFLDGVLFGSIHVNVE